MIYISYCDSPLGEILLSSDGKALTGLWMDTQRKSMPYSEKDCIEKELPVFEQTKRWLAVYFSGQEPDFDVPVALNGSDFQMAVWRILGTIPYGQTVTYGDIAVQIAQERGMKRMSAQAVGGAVGRNPVSILVPCHRVVGAGGNLVGYGGGLPKKIRLLEMEHVDMSRFFVPKEK